MTPFGSAGAGLDGVKVDCQAILGMVGGGNPGQGGGPAMSAEYHAAMEESVAHHFPGNNCINCMCHSTEDLYRWVWEMGCLADRGSCCMQS